MNRTVPSRDRRPQRICGPTGKLRYPTQISAFMAISRVSLKGKPERRAWSCSCGGFHLSSTPDRRSPRTDGHA